MASVQWSAIEVVSLDLRDRNPSLALARCLVGDYIHFENVPEGAISDVILLANTFGRLRPEG